MHLTLQEQSQINGLVAEFEAGTHAEVLVAVIGKADNYPEIPWKAFALGAAIAALLVVAHAWAFPEWHVTRTAIAPVTAMLGAGAACGLLAIFVPAFGRLFLDRLRAEAEVRQYAQALFLERRVFETHDRVGLLLLISLYERRVVVLPDNGLDAHLAETQVAAAIAGMAHPLARGDTAAAVQAGLQVLAAGLHGAPLRRAARHNELPDAAVQERGA